VTEALATLPMSGCVLRQDLGVDEPDAAIPAPDDLSRPPDVPLPIDAATPADLPVDDLGPDLSARPDAAGHDLFPSPPDLSAPDLFSCGTGLLCGLDCIDPLTNPLHCGSCANACTSNQVCTMGTCTPCGPGLVACGVQCADLTTDNLNCGACESVCATGVQCTAGTCSACAGSLTLCNGICVATRRDPLHCGGCNMPCPPNHPICVNGGCL
jgi:hypothetical protein